ncbi:MAG: hypothetical protein IKF16_10990 [Lachnospiraceae bacterium]|nr:hypothetical protein [Lachnospiraceae bacterium]
MALELSTAGIQVKYAVETTAGTRPTTGYTAIPGVKSIPEFGGEPNTLQTTPLSATVAHTYIKGLSDPGGAIGLTVNDYEDFRTAWTALMTAYSGLTGGKQLWIEYAYPASSNIQSFYFTAEPSELTFGGAEVDEVLENAAYLIPTGQPVWAAAST